MYLGVVRTILGKLLLLAILLFITFNFARSQSNLALVLGEESVLLDQLVTCGETDQQVVFFSSAGTDLSPRTNIQATLTLFPGISFDTLVTNLSSANVTLLDGTNPNRPIFSFPDFDPSFSEDIAIAFSVKIGCEIVDTLNAGSTLQVFDTWQLDYQIDGNAVSENFNGVEYKDAIAIPNLNIIISPDTEIYPLGAEVRRNLTISNSGLNSYLDNFDFSVVQEQGVFYQQLIINGEDYDFTKTANANGDTLISANIAGTVFNGNTQEFGAASNGDDLFDADEIITIEEVLTIISCGEDGNSNLNAIHQTAWGCNSEICVEESTTSNLSIGVGEELIEFTHNQGATEDAGYCEDGILSITVANNGFEFDDGFGAILDISAGVGFAVGADFLTLDQGYQILTVSIAGSAPISAPNGLVDLNNNPAFSTDPDGVGGLEDFDGDGFFDDLSVGQSFEITATYGVSCSSGAVFDIEGECDNDFRGNFDGKIAYLNACRTRSETLFDNFYRSSNTGSTQETCTDPDAFNDNDEFTIIYSGERRMSNFNRTCTGNDEIRISVSLPDGIQLSNETSIQQDTSRFTGVSQVIGNEAIVTFDAAPINLNNDYQLNFVFQTNCSTVGPTSFPVEITYFCPDCDCSHIWYCGILEGAVLHASGAPCAEFVCEIGLQTTNFEAERTTIGFTDENFTTPFDSDLANKKVALSCDSIVMKMTNIVGNQSLSDSIGLSINYGNADENDSEALTFLFSHAEITIQSGGNTNTCRIDTNAYQVEIVGNNKIMHFDLGSCLNGQILNRGDEINFTGHFAVSPDAPVPSNTFRKIPNFRAKGFAIIDGVQYDECDSFGELFRLAKLNTTFSGPSNSAFPQGCAATSLQYTLSKSINANAMREFFGEEHRAAAIVDSIEFIYDPNILTAFEDLSVEYRIQGSEWFPLTPLAATDNGVYLQEFSSLNTLSTITGSNQVFQFRINITPECSSIFGSALGNDLYDIEARVNYINRFHANEDNPDCLEINDVIDKRQFQYQNPPTFTLEAVVADITATGETVQWTIEHCNTSFDSDAGITFIQMETQSGNLEILTIENISVPTAIDTMILQDYGTENNVFAFADGLSQRGTNVDPADICNTFRITGRLVECGESSTAARLGWSCVPFDDPDWTPDDYEPCEAESVLLTAAAVAPLLSASFQEENSTISGVFCDTSTMVILVRNEEAGRAFDIQSQIILPAGATLVPSSVAFAYPSSAAFQPAFAEPNFQEQNELGQVYQYDNFANLNPFLDQNGLPGFSINAPDSSEFRIQYRFVTNCDFQNGELNRYNFQGITACGTASNIAFAETNPIIFEADPGVARTFDVQFSTITPLRSGQSSIFEISVENISPNVSVDDKIEIALSQLLTYTPNSIQGITPSDWTPIEPVIKVDSDVSVLNVALPAGLNQGESAVFRIEASLPDLICDSIYNANISTTSSIEFVCEVNNESCVFDFSSSNEKIFEIETSCNEGPCTITEGTINESILLPNCDSTMFYCFNQYTPEALENYTILDNGIEVDSARFSVCDFRQVCIYTYAQISNTKGAIEITSWTVNGVTFSGTVNSVIELVDSMNVWDEGGNWSLLPEFLIIEGGDIGGEYSRMEIFFPDSGIRSSLGYDTRLTPKGVSIFLTEGLHELIITDENDCADTLNLELIRQDCPVCVPPTVEHIIVENANCGEDNGTAIINIDGDPADYIFNWSPNVGTVGSTPNSRINLPATSYLVQIIDRTTNICFETIFVTVSNAEGPQSTATTTNTLCGQSNGSIELSPAEFTYSWQDGAIGASRTDLPEGRYIITVTDPAMPECTGILTVDLEAISPLRISHTVISDANCLNNNGAITINVEGGSGQYRTSFPDGNLTQTGLSGGSYRIIVTDNATGCTAHYLFILNNDVQTGAITILDTMRVSCVGDADGRVGFEIVYENGFIFPADTIITNGVDTFTNGNLPAGNYQLFVKDRNGCLAGSSQFTIPELEELLVNFSKTGDCDAQAIDVEVVGDAAPYIFDWADISGTENEQDRINLIGGNYLLTITNSVGCELPLAIELDSCTCVPASNINPTIIAADCGESNGEVSIEFDQNVEDYTFSYIPDLGTIGPSSNSRVSLPAGEYEVVVAFQGDTNCVNTIMVTVPENELSAAVILSTDITPADCGQNNGAINLTMDGIITDFTYEWDESIGAAGPTPNRRVDLPSGDYEVTLTITNNPNCSLVFPFTIPIGDTESSPLVDTFLTATTCGQANGAVTFDFIDNTILYDYTWTPDLGIDGSSPNSRINLPAGTYAVNILDPANPVCSYDISITIEDIPVMVDATVFPTNCDIPPTGSAVFSPADFVYTWPDGFVGNSRNELPPGIYSVSFSEPNGSEACQGVIEIEVELTTSLTAEAIINQQPTCEEANGEVVINVSGGTADYTYSWDSETNTNTDLAAGTYSVTVFDVTLGCQTIVDFDLLETPQGVASISITENIPMSCAENEDGGIQFTVDVTGDFQFPMDTIITDGVETFENGQLAAGDYCLEIRDANDCLTGEACFTIATADSILLMYEVVAACADTGAISLEITGGFSPYQVVWSDLLSTDNPINRTELDTGLYEVTVTDSRGCSEMASIFVPECDACNLPTITEISTTPTNCNDNTGSVFIELEEDVRDYDFFYEPEFGDPFVTGNIRATLPSGKYQVSIVYRPNPTCVLEIEVEIFEKDFSDLIPISSPADCGVANGQALLIPATNTYTWADGFVGNERTGLPSGFYQINVRDEVFDCETMITLVVDEINLLEAKIAVDTPPSCGNADGSVTININGGSGDYTFDWPGGNNTQENLSSGTYSVLVTDNRTGCRTPVVFTLIDAPSDITPITIEETINASCPLAADGAVMFTVGQVNTLDLPVDTIISNGHTQFLNGRLPQGDYCISIIDTVGCIYGQACFTIGAPEVIILTTDIIPACEEGGSISVEIEGGVAPYSFDWADVDGFADQANRSDLPVGIYTLTVTDVNGCEAILEEVAITMCEPCPLQVGRDTLRYNLTDCSETIAICLEYDFDTRNPFNVSLDGVDIDLFDINSCGRDTIGTYTVSTLFGQGRVGPYTVTAWPVNDEVFSGDFNNLDELVVAMNEWDPNGDWQFSEDGNFIVGGAPGSTYGQIEATVQGTPIMSFLSLETRIFQRGVSIDLSRGVHEVILEDPRTFCADTITVAVTCLSTDTLQMVLELGETDTICASTTELTSNLEATFIECLEETNLSATIFEDSCVIVEALDVGENTICTILCDDLGVCDTTVFEIDVQYGEIEDTILVQDMNTFCIDTLGVDLDGTIVALTEICLEDDSRNLLEVDLNLDSLCVNYTGKTLGEEEFCVEICDDLGFCDTLEFMITIQNGPPEQVIDTIFVGETVVFCFDSIIFPNIITFFENECPEESGESVDFFLDPINYCVEYTGQGIGGEQACIVLCDEDNICDTAFFDIEVIEFLELPTAVDDVDTTDKGVPLILNVKENDIPFGVDENGLQIIEDPLFGEAILNLDGSITYFGDEFCERDDQFVYTLCNSNGCDTATVFIYIECVDIVIFTAMSPNRDGINDVFFISDIEEFPNSELIIYNRWGNIVFQTTNYQNNWAGTWKNSQELPDGTYFYQLMLNEPNDDRMFEGFIELHR